MKVLDRTSVVALLVALLCGFAATITLKDLYNDQSAVENSRRQFLSARDGAFNRVEDREYSNKNAENHGRVLSTVGAGAKLRIAWVEQLSAAKAQLKLPEVHFDIYPRVSIVPKSSADSVDVGQETIVLKLGLLHEGELIGLLNYLEDTISAPFEILSLDVQKADEKSDSRVSGYSEINLRVICTIRWYSIDSVGEDIEQA